MATRTFKAKFTRQGGNWLVELVDEPRVHTFGRTLGRAKAMILDATALWYELDIDQVKIEGETGEVHFGDAELDAVVEEARKARADGKAAKDAELEKVGRAVEELSAVGVPLRDIAYVLGLSYQRVHQIHAVWANPV